MTKIEKLKNYFKQVLKELEISKNDNIVVHSNLTTFGFYEKKLPKIVVDELKKAVGINGTIIMPCYNIGINPEITLNKKYIIENPYISSLSKYFFTEKNIKRSNCPIHNHIGIGKNSGILLKSKPSNTYGKKSDFDLMKINKFKLVLLGCTAQEGATYFHQIEAAKNLKYGKWISFKRKILLNNKIKTLNVNFFEKKNVKHNLNRAINIISKKSKSFKTKKNKYSSSSIISLNELHELTLLELDKNPYFLVKNAKKLYI